MNNTLKNFLLGLILICFMWPKATPAAMCSPENVEKYGETVKTQLADSARNMVAEARKYNQTVQNFINACHPNIDTSNAQVMPDTSQIAAASEAGVDISDPALYQYLGVAWNRTSTSSIECQNQLNTVRAAADSFNSTYTKTQRFITAKDSTTADKCTCNEDGTVKECIAIDESEEELDVQKDGCLSFTEYHLKLSKCPLCPIFHLILNTMAEIANVSWNSVSKDLINIVGIFFLVLLGLESLKAIASFSGVKIGSYLKSVLTIGLRVAIAVLLLSNSAYIYNFFISPVVKGGLDMGMTLAEASGGATCSAQNFYTPIASEEFDPEFFNQVLDTVNCFGSSAAVTPAVGQGLFCHSLHAGKLSLPHLSMMLTGILMIIFGFIMWLAMAFYLIDCTVQLGMLTAIIPLLIACWPFKLTQSYSYKGVQMLMNTFFNYAMMGLVLLFGTQIIAYAASGGSNIESFVAALNSNDIDEVKKVADFSGFNMLVLIACSIFSLKLIGKVGDLASQFSGGAGGDEGAKWGGMVVGAAGAAAMFGAKSGLKLAGSGAKSAAQGIDNKLGISNGIKNAQAGLVAAHQRGSRALGRNLGLGRFQNQQTGSGLNSVQPTNPNQMPNSGAQNPSPNNRATQASNQENIHNNVNNPNYDKDGNAYDNEGKLIASRSVDKNGNITEKKYHANGSVLEESTKDKSGNEISWKSYHENGKLNAEHTVGKDGTRHWKTFNDDGTKRTSGSYNEKTGKRSEKEYDHGQLTRKAYDNKTTGAFAYKTYHKNGKIKQAGEGNMNSKSSHTEYDENGKQIKSWIIEHTEQDRIAAGIKPNSKT